MAATRGKTICFIDNANIFHGQADNNWRIDWEKFRRLLEEKGEVWQTYFFASETDPPSDGATAFYQFLKESLRWEVRLYTLGKKKRASGSIFTARMPAARATIASSSSTA